MDVEYGSSAKEEQVITVAICWLKFVTSGLRQSGTLFRQGAFRPPAGTTLAWSIAACSPLVAFLSRPLMAAGLACCAAASPDPIQYHVAASPDVLNELYYVADAASSDVLNVLYHVADLINRRADLLLGHLTRCF